MPTFADILTNPGLMKLELMRRGLTIPDEVRDALVDDGFGATGHALFGSAGDLDLVLPPSTWVTTPILPGLAASTPYALTQTGDAYAITIKPGFEDESEAKPSPVKIYPRAHFFQHKTSQGLPFGRIGTVHGPYLALSPSNRCTFLGSVDMCRFCGVGAGAGTHEGVPVEDILEAVRLAQAEHPVSVVYLSVGHLGTDDGGVLFLEPYVAAIKKHFDILVAVDALPPADDAWIDRTYGMGVDAISYNLEIYDPELFKVICPGPARVIGRQRFLNALKYATTVFPSGAVTCHLIVGLEPLESTRAGIKDLTERGVLPVLPVYRPFKGRDMRGDDIAATGDAEPTLDELVELYAFLFEQAQTHKLNLNVVRDISVVTTPLEARFFTGKRGFWDGLKNRVLASRVMRRTSARLSDLRRSLRVRDVSGLFDVDP